MIDLSRASGLPLSLDDSLPSLPVCLDGRLTPGELDTRTLADLQPALADREASGPDPAYFMYRGLALVSAVGRHTARRYQWRYDVTVFPPGRLGEECLRTLGHFHPAVREGEPSYPEVYEVLSGTALFLLQRVADYWADPAETRVLEFIILEAHAGEKAMMLPDYGHWTVNATDEPLVVSNWICDDFRSDYEPAVRAQGACCHLLADRGGVALRPNPRWAQPPPSVLRARPKEAPALGLVAGQPVFANLTTHPWRWRYLCDPVEAETDLRSAIEVTDTEPFPR
jgi:glucose-6-phosphate isomerase